MDMKITLHIPKGTKAVSRFVRKEIALAQNIKDKDTRNTVLSGLKAIGRFV